VPSLGVDVVAATARLALLIRILADLSDVRLPLPVAAMQAMLAVAEVVVSCSMRIILIIMEVIQALLLSASLVGRPGVEGGPAVSEPCISDIPNAIIIRPQGNTAAVRCCVELVHFAQVVLQCLPELIGIWFLQELVEFHEQLLILSEPVARGIVALRSPREPCSYAAVVSARLYLSLFVYQVLDQNIDSLHLLLFVLLDEEVLLDLLLDLALQVMHR